MSNIGKAFLVFTLMILATIPIGCARTGGDSTAASASDENASMVVEIKRAYSQIGRCENAGLKPRILWGNEWLTVQCDFIQDDVQH